MSKRMALFIGLALVVTPAAASGQDMAVSFRVGVHPAQPEFAEADGLVAGVRVPAGWAWSVSRGSGGGAGSARLATMAGEPSDSLEVALRVRDAPVDQPVTWVFVPL